MKVPTIASRHDLCEGSVTGVDWGILQRPWRRFSPPRAPDSIMLLSKRNYKVYADIGYDSTLSVRRLATLDTGAGPSFIRKDQLPPQVQSRIRRKELPSIVDANRKPISTLGTVRLALGLGNSHCQVEFIVADRLAVPLILGADFCDRYVHAIYPRRRAVELGDGSEVPIIRRPTKRHPGSVPIPASLEFLPAKGRVSLKVRACESIVLEPRTQTWVQVTAPISGLHALQPSENLYANGSIVITNGVVQVDTNRPFRVLIANMGANPYRVTKNQVLGSLLPHPTAIIPTNVSIAEVLGIDEAECQNLPSKHISRDRHEQPERKTTQEPCWQVSPDGTAVAIEGKRIRKTELAPKAAINQVNDLDLSHLAPPQRKRVRELLKEFAPMWAGELGEIRTTQHYIDLLPGSRPVAQQPYRAGPKARELEQREVEKMLQAGVIEPSQSAWASPVVMVPKPDGTLRFCVDYRRLNAMTARDSYPLPRMDECIDSLGLAQIFTTLDCNAGYWQLPVAERDRAKTAFVCHSGLFEYVRMPFGLKNAPASFQRTLDIILSGYKWKSCLVYLDDVIIFSGSFEDHLCHVRAVLRALKAAGITLKFAKCDFFTDKFKYLGHIIGQCTLSVDSIATMALRGARHPTTQTELRAFLGLCNVYRRFVANFAKLAGPLNALLRKGQPVELTNFSDEESGAFQALIDAVSAPPILALPKPGLAYSVDTDASNSQIGAALFQTHPDGERKPIGYWSRTLTSAGRNYSTAEKECLAVVLALGTLRPYLQAEKFIVNSDQASLRWLMEITEPSGRLMRWRLRISEFDFSVKYKKGTANTQADALSRLPTTGGTTVEVDEEIPCYIAAQVPKWAMDQLEGNTNDLSDDEESHDRKPTGQTENELSLASQPSGTMSQDDDEFMELDFEYDDAILATEETTDDEAMLRPVSVEELIQAQTSDPFCVRIRQRLNGGQQLPFEGNDEGLLCRRVEQYQQIIVPPELRPRILHIGHHARLAGAPGGRKLYTTLRREYYWPTMALDCYATVRNCAHCARNRLKLRRNAARLQLFPATSPLESVSIDILGELIQTPRGNRYLLVMCDRYSKLVRTVPLRRITALSVAKAFVSHWVFTYGPPADILSDNGKQFASRLFLEVCRIIGIRNKFTTTYHAQCNGQVERFNRTVLAALRHYVADHPKEWDLFSDAVTYAYNTQTHASTGLSPFQLVLSKTPRALAMEELPKLRGENPSLYHRRWLSRLQALMETANAALSATQRRYQRNFNSRLRRSRNEPTAGSYVFLRKEQTSRTGDTRHKLAPLATGPFKVISVHGRTVVIQIGDDQERVSRDRVQVAPSPANIAPPGTQEPLRQLSSPYEVPNGLLDLPVGEADTVHSPKEPTGIWLRTGTRNATQAMEPPGDAAEAAQESEQDKEARRAQDTNQHRQGAIASMARLAKKARKRKRVGFARPLATVIPTNSLQGGKTPDTGLFANKGTGPRGLSYLQGDSVFDHLVGQETANDGTTWYRIRWYGYTPDEDTLQPIGDIPRSKILQYCRRNRLDFPLDIKYTQRG